MTGARFAVRGSRKKKPAHLAPRTAHPWSRIYAVVRRVPRGKVATYGQIALLTGLKNHARQVGYALHALPTGSNVPWHRVINAQGKVSSRAEPDYVIIQQKLLESEGIEIGAGDRISLKRFGWKPR